MRNFPLSVIPNPTPKYKPTHKPQLSLCPSLFPSTKSGSPRSLSVSLLRSILLKKTNLSAQKWEFRGDLVYSLLDKYTGDGSGAPPAVMIRGRKALEADMNDRMKKRRPFSYSSSSSTSFGFAFYVLMLCCALFFTLSLFTFRLFGGNSYLPNADSVLVLKKVVDFCVKDSIFFIWVLAVLLKLSLLRSFCELGSPSFFLLFL